MGLRKMRKTVAKMMLLQWTSEIHISALEAKGHWATLEEFLKVAGRYLLCYEGVLKSCKKLYLSFATEYLVMYLLIKVKGSNPITY